MSIKNIIFDIGNVLAEFRWKEHMKDLDIPDEAIKHLEKNMMCHKLWNQMDLNVIPEDDIRRQFKEISPQYSEYIDRFLDNMEDVVSVYPGRKELLKHLRDMGYRIYLLSNYPKRMFEMHERLKFDFMPYVDGKVVSYQYKVVKPDIEIYRILCDKYDINPAESIFLDDRADNVEASKKIGFDAILIDNPDKLEDKLMDALNICENVRKELFAKADIKYKEFSKSLSPMSGEMIGVRIPELRKIAKRITKGNWRSFVRNCEHKYFEETMLVGYVIGYADVEIDEMLSLVRSFVPNINDWAINDGFVSTLKKTSENREKVWLLLEEYMDSDKEFEQRFVATMLMTYYLEDEYIDRVFKVLDGLNADGYYRMMGVAWAVATAFAKYPEKTYTYMKNNSLDDVTYNKAIQKMIESYRISEDDKKILKSMKRK